MIHLTTPAQTNNQDLSSPRVRPAVQCTECPNWLVADKSVARRMGPVCAARASHVLPDVLTLFDVEELAHA